MRRSSCFILLAVLATSIPTFVSAAKPEPGMEPGTVRNTPPDMTYYARQGDTLGAIAERFTEKNANWTVLAKRNHIGNDRTIPVGTAILIPLELLPEQPATAKVVALAGSSSFKSGNGSDTALELGTVLNEGNTITTGKNGFLSLELVDNSRVSIPSNSQVLLSKLRVTKFTKSPRTELKLLQGRVESTVTSLESNKGRYEVRTPLAIAGVRGTHFRVSLHEDSVSNEVLQGKVAVGKTEKPNALLLPAGQGNLINSNSVGSAVDLLPPPALTGNYQLQERPTIQFFVEKNAKASSYRAQIAADAQAQNLLMEAGNAEARFKFDGLPDGQYFVRLSAIDAQGLEGIPSISPFTLKARPEPPFSVQPKAKLRADKVDFVWTEAAGASAYRLQVASDAGFQHMLVDQEDIHDVQYNTDQLKPGNYYWRLATIAQRQGHNDQGPYGDVQAFVLMPPQIMTPVSDSGGKDLSFGWPAEAGQTFLIQIARDAAFKDMYLSKELQQPELSIPRPDPGEYFIRVRATDADGYVGAFTSTQKLTIVSRWVTSDGETPTTSSGPLHTGF